jgi:hypothetical protein
VWAQDSHTLGYATANIDPSTTTRQAGPLSAGTIDEVTVWALDTDAAGGNLLTGRVLLRVPGGDGVVTSAVMDRDGRSGFGVMLKGQPASTVLFSFAEAQPIRVTRTIPPSPNSATMVALSTDGPRYACLSGIDAFGRVINGAFMAAALLPGCRAASNY